jgi:hypothetical protein
MSKGIGQLVDDMLQMLRQAAERLGPGSPYMQTLRSHEAAVRSPASAALASPNPADRPYGSQLSSRVSLSRRGLPLEKREVCYAPHGVRALHRPAGLILILGDGGTH